MVCLSFAVAIPEQGTEAYILADRISTSTEVTLQESSKQASLSYVSLSFHSYITNSFLPMQGHEFCGTIHSLGLALPDQPWTFQTGDRVVSPFTTSCGACFFCERGFTGRCVKGSVYGCEKLDGAQAEYVKVPLASEFPMKA